MASKQGKKVSLSIVLFPETLNLTDVYTTASEFAEKNEAEFHGIYLYELPTKQPVICNSLYFTLSVDYVQTLLDGILVRLNLPRSVVRCQINDAPSDITKSLPEGFIR